MCQGSAFAVVLAVHPASSEVSFSKGCNSRFEGLWGAGEVILAGGVVVTLTGGGAGAVVPEAIQGACVAEGVRAELQDGFGGD